MLICFWLWQSKYQTAYQSVTSRTVTCRVSYATGTVQQMRRVRAVADVVTAAPSATTANSCLPHDFHKAGVSESKKKKKPVKKVTKELWSKKHHRWFRVWSRRVVLSIYTQVPGKSQKSETKHLTLAQNKNLETQQTKPKPTTPMTTATNISA